MDVYGIRRPESCRRLRQIAAAKLHSYNAAGSPGVADLSVDASVTQVGDVVTVAAPITSGQSSTWLPIPRRSMPATNTRSSPRQRGKDQLLNSDRRTSFDASFQHDLELKSHFPALTGISIASSATPMIWSGANGGIEFVSWSDANVSDYAISLDYSGGDSYRGAFLQQSIRALIKCSIARA